MEWLVEFYRRTGVELVCSLPCYTAENTDRQRGAGVFDKSIAALRNLNAAGFGRGELRLDLVYNPVGATLPPPQAELEAQYRDELARNFGIVFDRLLTITNMPIARFANQLSVAGNHSAYMSLLVNHFNPATVDSLMCRDLVSIGWDGRLYDCDFNQMLEIPLVARRIDNLGHRRCRRTCGRRASQPARIVSDAPRARARAAPARSPKTSRLLVLLSFKWYEKRTLRLRIGARDERRLSWR